MGVFNSEEDVVHFRKKAESGDTPKAADTGSAKK